MFTSLSGTSIIRAIDTRNKQILYETDVVRDFNPVVREDEDDIGESMDGGLSEPQLMDHWRNYR